MVDENIPPVRKVLTLLAGMAAFGLIVSLVF